MAELTGSQTSADTLQHDMQLVAELASGWMDAASETEVYAGLADGLRRVVGDDVLISVSNYDSTSQAYMPQVLVGLGPIAEKVAALLGKAPIDLTGDFPQPVKQAMASGQLTRIEGGVAALAGNVIPPILCHRVAKLLELEDVFVVGFAKKDFKGGACIITRRPGTALRKATIEALARTAGVAIENKRAKEALRKSEERFSSFMANSPAASWIIDKDNRYVFLNQTYRRMFAVGDGEVVGRSISELYPKEIADEYLAYNRRTLREGRAVESIEPGIRPDGTDGRFLVIKFPLRGVSGEDMIGGFAIDITERQRAEAGLKASEERYRLLIDNAPLGILSIHRSGAIAEVNPEMVKILGAPSVEAIRRFNIFDLPGMRESGFVSDIQRCIDQEETVVAERRFFSWEKETSLRWHIRAVRNAAGAVTGAQGIVEDTSAIKQIEEEKALLEGRLQQAERLDSVGRLAGGVAHDLNNMLGVILGHAEMALARVDQSLPLHADLEEIQKAAQRSAGLTRQLLAFARKQTVSPKVIDLNATIESMLQMLRRLIGEDIDLKWQPNFELWPVRMDPSQIDQILVNLCVNARDAISGAGKLIIETGNVTFDGHYCAAHAGHVAGGEYVQLAVSDNGCGMSREMLPHLFEPFFTTKEIGKGTGLGLATVYGIVKQNNGFIDVNSEPGAGTTFKIYFPRQSGEVKQAATVTAAGPIAQGHETILLVEDEPVILRMTKRILEQFGYAVVAASTPSEAIRLAKAHAGEIHLLMTDVVMPEMNGRELGESLASSFPGIKRLFMSGHTANVIAHHGVLGEGINFIQKPFSVLELEAKVRAVLEHAVS